MIVGRSASLRRCICAVIACAGVIGTAKAQTARIDVTSQEVLTLPPLSTGSPAAGERVTVTPPEFAGTDVFHTIYLPRDWKPDGSRLPIIFEYTGNHFPQSGSTGEPEDAALGYGLSAGRYIWVSLPCISEDHADNAVRWWGDERATVAYAKRYVPAIVEEFHADSRAIFLCGFSRGAIGVNYIGLHDDEIARLWTAFVSHDHFDGVKEWRRTDWGSPLKSYRQAAIERLRRVGGRPYLVSQNRSAAANEAFIRSALTEAESRNCTFHSVPVSRIIGPLPNQFGKTTHTDRWLFKPSPNRQEVWRWMNSVVSESSGPQAKRRSAQ